LTPAVPSLALPSFSVHHSYVAAIGEYQQEGHYRTLDVARLADPAYFRRFVRARRAVARPGGAPPPYGVPETVLWYVEGTTFVGHVSIRHRLTDWLLEQGGHIGYDVRPSARRNGHATAMLHAALPLARRIGIDPALVTCVAGNTASRRVIEHAGGRLEDERAGRLRFWVPTVVAGAGSVPAVGPSLPVVVAGVVVAGDRRGRELGFPTANVSVPAGTALPAEGVYAGWVRRANGDVHVAAISVGRRATYYGDEGEVLLEAFLLDFSGDLYGERLEVGIEAAVRGQERFETTEALVERMRLDVEAVSATMARRAVG
jgi:predicted acetyltransferase